MRLPFTQDEFLDVFAAYNTQLWAFALVLWLLTIVAVVRSGAGRQRLLIGVLALHWLWSALVYHALFFSRINPAAWFFSALFVAEAGLLAWSGLERGRLVCSRGRTPRHLLALMLIAYALLYPFVVAGDGYRFPRAPTFGVPCPTTIITLGVLLSLDRRPPLLIILVPLLWAVIGGSAAVLLGMHADLMLPLAGAAVAMRALLFTTAEPGRQSPWT